MQCTPWRFLPHSRCWRELDLPLFQKVFQTNQDCTFLTARRQKRTCDKSHNNEAWWKLLGETVTKYKIKEENTDTTDEVGIQAQGGGECEYVFGSHKKAAPYQQCSGTCENITTIVTVCVDGTSMPPAVIFKGSTYQVKWGKDNPLNAWYVILIIMIFMCKSIYC